MKPVFGQLDADIAATPQAEIFTDLVTAPHCRIERIVSLGQATPPCEWLAQDRAEWVVLLRGSAVLRFADEAAPRNLKPGDHVLIPPKCRHRVDATAADEPTLWLAVHYDA